MERNDLIGLLGHVDRCVRATVAGEPPPAAPRGAAFDEPASMFVTLRVAGELRGCIGTLERIGSAAATATRLAAQALQDPRFHDRRVRRDELDRLAVELQVLSAPRRVASPDEIEVGRHGIVVQAGGKSGVFLPQVATDQGWSALQAVRECCRIKLRLPPDAWQLQDARLEVFEGSKVSTEHDR